MWYSFKLFSSHRLRNFSFSSRSVYLSTGVPSDFVSQVERAYSRSNFFLSRNRSRARWKFERPGLDQFVYNSWWNCRKRSLTFPYPHFNIKRSSREEEDLVLPRNIILENANANSIFGKEKKKKKIVLSIQMQRRKEKKKRWRDERELIEGEWKTGSNLTSSFFISRYLQYVKIPFKRDFNRVIPPSSPFKPFIESNSFRTNIFLVPSTLLFQRKHVLRRAERR